MNGKSLLASLMILALLTFSVGQVRIIGSGVIEDTGAPSTGSTWLHDTTKDVLHYSADFDKWIGPTFHVVFDKNANDHTGAMRFQAIVNDTATGNQHGHFVRGRYRILGAYMASTAADSPNCTTYVFADQDTVMKFDWGGSNQVTATPTADSSGAWIWASTRAIIADGTTISMYIKPAAASPENPDQPLITLHCVREEDP